MLDPENIRHESSSHSTGTSEALLDFPILAEAIEEMMLSRYDDSSDDKRWSEDARNFLSCTLSGTLKNIMKVEMYLSLKSRMVVSNVRIASLLEACGVPEKIDSADPLCIRDVTGKFTKQRVAGRYFA